MAEPLEIKRIDLLVHQFAGLGGQYHQRKAHSLLRLWKKHVNATVKNSNRLLLVMLPRLEGKANKLSENLLEYAKIKLGKRFGFFRAGTRFRDIYGNEFNSFKHFAKANGFVVDRKTVKTRGFGEFTNDCVASYLTQLNIAVGLQNPSPYRNKQSALLPRESIAGLREYPLPWQLKRLRKTVQGRKKLKEWMQEYMQAKSEKARKLSMVYKGVYAFTPRQIKPKRPS